MAFKKPLSESGIQKSREMGDGRADFIESASGGNVDSSKQGEEPRMISVKLPPRLIERVKRYQKSDMARRIDTQSYIFEQALTQWLDERGVEK